MRKNISEAGGRGHSTRMHRLFAAAPVASSLALTAVPWAARAQVAAEATGTLSSSDRGVTVRVTLKSVDSPEGRWEFAIVLGTHSAELSDDLMQSASLSTDDGRTIKPLEWAGAPPDEAAPRTFRWQP